jgi:hypothetical protein
MAMRTETAIERVFNRCNLIGEDVDIYEIMMQYKVLREKTIDQQESIYYEIAERLGFLMWR